MRSSNDSRLRKCDHVLPSSLEIADEVLVESRALDDDVVVGLLTAEKLAQSSGRRYLRARRPDLYGKLVEPPPPGQEPVTMPGWRMEHETGSRDPGTAEFASERGRPEFFILQETL